MRGVGLFFGFAFGFLLAAGRLTDYDVIHNMLLLRDFEPYLIMGSAVVVAVPILYVLQRLGWRTPFGGALVVARSRIGREHILGSVTFGAGWAVAGTCPGPALAMIGSGLVMGLIVVAGLMFGLSLRDAHVVRRAAPASRPADVAAAPTRG
jgi:uncharacterized membrane protein YedE/YeeE